MPNLKSIVESLLFVADAPMTFDRLCSFLDEFDRGDIREALGALQEEYGQEGRGVVLVEVASGYQFRTPVENADYLRRLTKTRPVKFSQSALETLAIIAYRQPVTRAEIEYLRGVDCGGVLKTILEKKLIKILGKKDIPGKPLIYGTTREFLELFSLKDLRSLPTLKEIRDLSETASYEQQEELPLEQPEDDRELL
ncbi:chromosome segregation and condensation protein, ScpB [Geobacter metallireducens RCH3]|uniref:Chromosome segregation and condensation protein ScpB n=1 Tax=Geobacter metallireducens (strain ATCC 53774 / DSM 7210 / GS-15) TaxID=269799 RepID=Q39U87_GEOMG|nr:MULTISPECIES: SMC-Scp complex subunit ScpB [Geobacter]ABB32187.1 chromosome segregation and condensation protein ScpB [Geobacter metallireducens GS-15]EHP88624.1 chromosome segregation and condensation protein, ScpB [Geobacter metallireducens RCH3]MBT1074605.1 SMC-Scp complex subunit ScpB [Geobacter grbiciae]